MRRQLWLATAILSLGVCSAVAQSRTIRAAAWRNDLTFLATNLPALHVNAFFQTTRDEFNAAVLRLNERIPELSDAEIIVELARIVASIGDAHTYIPLNQFAAGFHVYPLRFEWLSDGLFVTQVAGDYENVLGLRVKSINGVAIDEAVDRIANAISHQNTAWLERMSADYLTLSELLFAVRIIPSVGPAMFEFATADGSEVTASLAPLTTTAGTEWITALAAPLPLWRRDLNVNYWYEYLSESKTVFFKYNICQDASPFPTSMLFSLMLALVDAQPGVKVVIDLRDNSGGNSSVLIPFLQGLERRSSVGTFDLNNQLIGLIGKKTFSAAVDNANFIRLLNGRLVGEATGGKPNGYGNVRTFTLPQSQLIVQYSTTFFREVAGDPPSLDPDITLNMRGSDYFAGRDPLLESVLALTPATTDHTPTAIYANGGSVLETAENSPVRIGHASVEADMAGGIPLAMAIFRSTLNGVTVSEAGVPVVSLIQRGRLFVESKDFLRTGIAISNPLTTAAVISFTFTNVDGSEAGHGVFNLDAGKQKSVFINEAPFRIDDFEGALTLEATSPVAVVALRGFLNERAEFLITTLPVVDLSTAPPANPVLPHFADGGGWTTDILLVNASDREQSGTLRFSNGAGQLLETVRYIVAAQSASRIHTAEATARARSGNILVLPDFGGDTPSVSGVLRFTRDGVTISEGALIAVAPAASFKVFAEASGAFSAKRPGSLSTGIAIANPSSASVAVQVTLRGLNGVLMGNTAIGIQPGGSVSLFLKEIDGFAGLQTPLRGVVTITASRDVAVTAVRARYNERGDFLFAATPSSNQNARIPTLYFPHLAAGGSYATQFVFIDTSGNPSSAAIRFFDADGLPLNLSLR